MIGSRGNSNPAFTSILRAAAALLPACLLIGASCAAEAQPANKFRFTIVNDTKFLVNEIRTSPSGATSWGPDLTGDGDLRPGRTFIMMDITPGQYDVKFVDADENSCILKNVPIFSEMSWTITPAWLLKCEGFGRGRSGSAPSAASAYRLTIKNNSKFSMHEILMSPSGGNNWGIDRTGDAILKPGDTFTLKDIAPGQYDLKFVNEDGNLCILKSMKISDHVAWTITPQWALDCEGFRRGRSRSAQPPETIYWLAINNSSKVSVHEIRMSPGGANNWGSDRTGDATLGPGETFTVKVTTPGQYDVKFVDEGGDSCILKGINVSGRVSWSITPQWLQSCAGFGRGRSTTQKF